MSVANVTAVIKSLGLGGAERLLVDSLPYLDSHRFRYRVAYVTPWKNTLVPEIESHRIPVTCLGEPASLFDSHPQMPTGYVPARSLKALTLLPASLRRLQRLMAETHCDLLQADMPVSGILARIAGRRASVPVAYTEHNLQERFHPVTRWANRATYGWNNVVFAVSDEVAASIRRNGLDRSGGGHVDVRTLPNGVPVDRIQADAADVSDLRREFGLLSQHQVVGTVAVLRPQKRLSDWLAVAQRVAQSHPEARFLIVGDGPDMSTVRQRVREVGPDFAQRVLLAGFRDDGRRLVALVDVYLMTSEYEGLPVAMLEAMALGKPIVATSVGGIPEVVSHGREGLLASVGNVELLAAHVRALLSNPLAASEMGARGLNSVAADFHTRKRVTAMESAYAELLAARWADAT